MRLWQIAAENCRSTSAQVTEPPAPCWLSTWVLVPMTASLLGWSLPIRNPLQLMIAALPITSSTAYGSSRSARKLSTRSGEYSRTPSSSPRLAITAISRATDRALVMAPAEGNTARRSRGSLNTAPGARPGGMASRRNGAAWSDAGLKLGAVSVAIRSSTASSSGMPR
jgi:hypothetical protein